MKYSDHQRVEKIRETTEKLLDYVRTEHNYTGCDL